MDPAYTDRLESVVRNLPPGPCAVGLVVASGTDWVPASAGDFAATVSRGRTGHTILVSLASDQRDLDHELGVESRLGLSDVLAGGASLKSVAARSEGRGYIYLPQGASPARGRRVLESRAWRTLQNSALARGATLLILLPPEAIHAGSALGLTGLVLLGVEADELPSGDGREGLPPILGVIEPPGGKSGEPGSSAPPVPSRPVVKRSRRRRRKSRGRRPRSGSSKSMPAVRQRGSTRGSGKSRRKSRRGPGKGSEKGSGQAPVGDGPPEKPARPSKVPVIAAVVVVALLAVIVLVVAAVTGARNRAPFLEQNDSLWLAPVPAGPSDSAAAADSANTLGDPTQG